MLWGSHPEKKSYMCLTFCTVSSPWRQLALLSWYASLCRIEGWQNRATFTAVHDFYKHEKLKQNLSALTHIRVAGGSCRGCGFVPRWGHTPQLWCSISSLLPCWIVSLLVVFDTWDALYQWLPANETAFLQGSPKHSAASWSSSACVCASLELLSFGPSKPNFFIVCPWAILSKPVSTLVWTVMGVNHSYVHETNNGKCNGSKEQRQIIVVFCTEQPV